MKTYSIYSLLVLLTITVTPSKPQTNKSAEPDRPSKVITPAAQSKGEIARKLLGTWKIISLEIRDSNGQPSYPYGREPKGYITYDSTGHMGVHIMNPDRPKPDPGSSIARGYIAYFGTYDINEKEGVVIHHMEGNTNPSLTGTDYIRYYDFDGDVLTLTAANLVDGKLTPKSATSVRVTWRRVR
jgi:hypothetical protein